MPDESGNYNKSLPSAHDSVGNNDHCSLLGKSSIRTPLPQVARFLNMSLLIWNTGDQTMGLQGHSSIAHNGKVYSVWWQIGRGTNLGGNNRVVAEIGWNETGTNKYGAQTHLFTHSVGNNDFFEVDPKGNGEVDFKFDGTTETLDWNDSNL